MDMEAVLAEGIWPGRLLTAAVRLLGARSRCLFAAAEGQADPGREAVDRQAERLLADYGNSILRLAYSYLHNMSDAEAVVQDTLMRYVRTTPVFADENHQRAWLLRVAGNLSKNRLAYNALRRTDELQEELVSEEREDLSFVWEAVKALPVKYREVIHLFYYEGCSAAQIAGIVGRKESTVRSDLLRGRERLRKLLREEYGFGEV